LPDAVVRTGQREAARAVDQRAFWPLIIPLIRSMLSPAYSDIVNHAFAYAGIHHAGQRRKGTRLPYITHLANVAVILARYNLDERTIAAAILHDVVEDCEEHSRDVHTEQIEAKFGRDVLETVLSVTKPRTNESGEELNSAQGKQRYLDQLRDADRSAH
jgi:(p)ppGpp synthase/HD superfamily hydrolase